MFGTLQYNPYAGDNEGSKNGYSASLGPDGRSIAAWYHQRAVTTGPGKMETEYDAGAVPYDRGFDLGDGTRLVESNYLDNARGDETHYLYYLRPGKQYQHFNAQSIVEQRGLEVVGLVGAFKHGEVIYCAWKTASEGEDEGYEIAVTKWRIDSPAATMASFYEDVFRMYPDLNHKILDDELIYVCGGENGICVAHAHASDDGTAFAKIEVMMLHSTTSGKRDTRHVHNHHYVLSDADDISFSISDNGRYELFTFRTHVREQPGSRDDDSKKTFIHLVDKEDPHTRTFVLHVPTLPNPIDGPSNVRYDGDSIDIDAFGITDSRIGAPPVVTGDGIVAFAIRDTDKDGATWSIVYFVDFAAAVASIPSTAGSRTTIPLALSRHPEHPLGALVHKAPTGDVVIAPRPETTLDSTATVRRRKAQASRAARPAAAPGASSSHRGGPSAY